MNFQSIRFINLSDCLPTQNEMFLDAIMTEVGDSLNLTWGGGEDYIFVEVDRFIRDLENIDIESFIEDDEEDGDKYLGWLDDLKTNLKLIPGGIFLEFSK